MGEFIGYIATILIIFASNTEWRKSIYRGLFFLIIFFVSLAPWYYRNYQLTHQLFFCPTIGTYLNCFSVPKILRRILEKPLTECHALAQQTAARAIQKELPILEKKGLYASPAICKKVSFPIIFKYPIYFAYDWICEVLKTTFDLYCYQSITMLNNSYWYDPIEEFLLEKILSCLFCHPMPWVLRFACYIEFCAMLILWLGILGGFIVFLILPKRFSCPKNKYSSLASVWLISSIMISTILGMTGGFGYARLRLPAEPLLIILSLIFWVWLYNHRKGNPNETHICTLA